MTPRQLDPTNRRQIYHQGSLDGACFLYAVANAYKALTGKKVGRAEWDRAIGQLALPAAFLSGIGATQLSSDEAAVLLQSVLSSFSDPGEAFAIDQLAPAARIADLCAAVASKSVVAFAFGGPTEFQHPTAHIVCGVAATARDGLATLHLACSAAFAHRHLLHGQYDERHHAALGRYSNDSISADDPVEVSPNFRWRITLASRGA